MVLETALRRPGAMREALTFALQHKHLYEYVRDTSKQLDELIREIRAGGGGLLPAGEGGLGVS
jgi:hypothetical protein